MTEQTMKSPEERKAELEEALKRLRPRILGNSSSKSVAERVTAFATRPDEPASQETTKTAAKKPMNLAGLAKDSIEIDKRARRAGLEAPHLTKEKDKDDKNKDKEKEKDKDKENTPEKQEAKMKEMFSKVKLPSGMEIHQEGPQWVLVSKDGQQRTDVTDVMNTIDKFNRNVDAANEQNRMENAAQSGVDKAVDINKKDNGLLVSETSSRVQIVGEALPKVTGADGQPVFKQEDIRAIAETAINFSNEKALLEKLKDPKALEEMRKREKKNEQNAEYARQKQIEKVIGGR